MLPIPKENVKTVFDLAEYIHSKACRQNHADGCGWFYELERSNTKGWLGSEHLAYLHKANKLMELFPLQFKSAIEAVDILFS